MTLQEKLEDSHDEDYNDSYIEEYITIKFSIGQKV